MGLHVIILGAGASYTSGYPLADELRLRLSSHSHFHGAWSRADTTEMGKETALYENTDYGRFRSGIQETVDLFRYGGFATVDEFCKLAQRNKPEAVAKMKILLRAALLIHNPETAFQESDYYGFIQKLFIHETPQLRQDIAVLSFNYDCYLDFLLARAYRKRCSCAGIEPDPSVLNRILFGLNGVNEEDLPEEGFYLIKLHGTICPPDSIEDFQNMVKLGTPPYSRIQSALKNPCDSIVFPWELENAFHRTVQGELSESRKSLEKGWAFGRSLIRRADKVSFVGLSFHEFLNDGFRKLFSLRSHKTPHIAAVVADTLNREFDYSDSGQPPRYSPVGRCLDALKKSCPHLTPCRSDIYDRFSEHLPPNPWVTPRASFKEFIQREML